MSKQPAPPATLVSVDLTKAERRMIGDDLFIWDTDLLRPIAYTPSNRPVEMSLDDVDDLIVYLDRELRRDYLEQLWPRLRKLRRKLVELLESHGYREPPPSDATTQEETFPIRFTQAQRRVIAEFLPELAIRMKLDENASRVIRLNLSEMRQIKKRARRAVCAEDITGKRRTPVEKVIDVTCEALQSYQPGSIARIATSERLYQFRISIVGINPEIWRRIQVKECTLDRLHEHIQLAFGWWNYHLYQFMIDGVQYGIPCMLDDGFEPLSCHGSSVTQLHEIASQDGSRFRFKYEYDFGDGWEHEVLFEGCLRAKKGQQYPQCLEGERAGPPEDVGGVCGYYDYLEALADPDHEEHKDLLAWRGPYDPDAFDADKVTIAMRRGMPKPKYDG